MRIQFLEIVTADVDGMMETFAASNGVEFSDPIAEFGNGRIAQMPGGGKVSVRAPMHESEEPATRTYFLTNDIETATEKAVSSGAVLAHPVMEIEGHGKFSILFPGGIQFGYWQT